MPVQSAFIIVAIDGAAASGKSSTSRGVAERLGLMYVDTGAHYRTLTHALLTNGCEPENGEAIRRALESVRLDTRVDGRAARMTVDGEPLSEDQIRSPEVNARVSRFAALPAVREHLFQYQRSQAAVARRGGYAGLVMEGRDIGSVIFPDADFRFFLEADEATRADRRALQGEQDSIAVRDRLDSTRKSAPLRCPPGAVKVDTGSDTLEGVIDTVCRLIEGRHDG